MIPEQRRKILEAAAKACCYTPYWNPSLEEWQKDLTDPYVNGMVWNPIDNPADTANMCAKMDINTFYYLSLPKVECSAEDAGDEQVIRYTSGYANNPGEKLKAWMFAATMVAAKIGGYKDES